ncbi:JAB domain-containing protein [Paenibacillus kandeliae]|uniref:JAB domain-containing protein n=1 Tax=Paenibacillus kandeliae TaxID=3231269 RepID=UPI00345806C7
MQSIFVCEKLKLKYGRLKVSIVTYRNIIGIHVLNHIIIGENRYYSLEEHGHMCRVLLFL